MRHHHRTWTAPVSAATCVLACAAWAQPLSFVDATAPAGLAGLSASRLCLVHLNGDDRPDLVVRVRSAGEPDRYRVYLNQPANPTANPPANQAPPQPAWRFVEVGSPNLPTPSANDVLVFADFDNDAITDALWVRHVPAQATSQPAEQPAPDPALRTSMLWGKGEGTFADPVALRAAPPRPTIAVAVGDVDGDALLDVFLGNNYTAAASGLEAFATDLLVQQPGKDLRDPDRFRRVPLPEDGQAFDPATDLGGRPTYGTLITNVIADGVTSAGPQLLALGYGRRANRLWVPEAPLRYTDRAPALALDGDADRSGTYPAWLKDRARTDPRFDRADELPFRSHGNTFDASITDFDRDGRLDVVLAEITHGWAGPSSDRSRILLQRTDAQGGITFAPAAASLDRVPADPSIVNWNQGDLFVEFADLDHDGRADVVLSSGDYPDNQRLRIFRQQDDGTLRDVTSWAGVHHEGSQQISLGDVDGDGDLDILSGQSFNRLGPAQVEGRTPALKLLLNQTVERRAERLRTGLALSGVAANSLTLRLVGSPGSGSSRDALLAIVRVTADLDNNPATPAITQTRILQGPGGHAGKQHEFLVHFGLGSAPQAAEVSISWPSGGAPTVRTALPAGRHSISQP